MIAMQSKAKTLAALESRVSRFQVPDFLFFTAKDIRLDHNKVVEKIIKHFADKNCKLAIRSSAIDEDAENSAKAGEYRSILNVSSKDESEILTAIQSVLASFSRNGSRVADELDEIIVQKMVEKAVMSGVVFTHELNSGAPYYVINYDDISGLTNTITGGDSEYANRTLYIYRAAKSDVRSERFRALLDAIDELELLLDNKNLDIEFALSEELVPHLLQVRAISTKSKWVPGSGPQIGEALAGVHRFVKSRFRPIDGLIGDTTVFGQMPDWNPAEMIGRVPRVLSYSLYRKLITDDAWRDAREEMGYCVPEGQPLMVSLAGQPFIDTRLSFHSFLPSEINPLTAKKLVNGWLDHLKQNPHLHDKVEFEVAITTFSFDIDEKIKDLTHGVLSKKEIAEYRNAVKIQTRRLLSMDPDGSLESAKSKINILSDQLQQPLGQLEPEITQLYGMIDNCKKYGTTPFSVLARHGFIAKTLLMSLQKKGLFNDQDVRDLMASIQTVAGDLVDDLALWKEGELTKNEFLS